MCSEFSDVQEAAASRVEVRCGGCSAARHDAR
jgi:hypothetical protein